MKADTGGGAAARGTAEVPSSAGPAAGFGARVREQGL